MNVREQLGHGVISGRGGLLALLLNAAIVCAVRGADDAAKPLVVAADTAIVDVQLPPGAKVIVDGAESTQTRLTYRPLAPGQTRREEVRVRFRDGKEITRSLLLRGGWHVRLPVKGSGESKLRRGGDNSAPVRYGVAGPLTPRWPSGLSARSVSVLRWGA